MEEEDNIKNQNIGLPANHIFWEACWENAEGIIESKYCLRVKVLNTTEYRACTFYKPISRVFSPNIFNHAKGDS